MKKKWMFAIFVAMLAAACFILGGCVTTTPVYHAKKVKKMAPRPVVDVYVEPAPLDQDAALMQEDGIMPPEIIPDEPCFYTVPGIPVRSERAWFMYRANGPFMDIVSMDAFGNVLYVDPWYVGGARMTVAAVPVWREQQRIPVVMLETHMARQAVMGVSHPVSHYYGTRARSEAAIRSAAIRRVQEQRHANVQRQQAQRPQAQRPAGTVQQVKATAAPRPAARRPAPAPRQAAPKLAPAKQKKPGQQ